MLRRCAVRLCQTIPVHRLPEQPPSEDAPKCKRVLVKAGRKRLEFTFEGHDEPVRMTAEYLRVNVPSADRLGHETAATAKVVSGKRDVKIAELFQIGNYALQIQFSDGHKNGIFGWSILWGLHKNKYKEYAPATLHTSTHLATGCVPISTS